MCVPKRLGADTLNDPDTFSSVNVAAEDRTQNPPNDILMSYDEPTKSLVWQ
jgi:hypothetical protein